MRNDEKHESYELPGHKETPKSHGRHTSRITELNIDEEGLHEVFPQEQSESSNKQRYGFRVWATIVALSFTQLLTALEGTVVSTALPTIVDDLDGSSDYVWVSSGYFLTSTVLQPLFGQVADIFGRKGPILFAVSMFMLGSGISGAAPSMNILVAGRVLQGVGGGGISVLCNVIVCDMFPLKQRGMFLALIMIAVSLGTAIGPFLGGVITEHSTWRWVFYLNLPVGGFALALLVLFLREHPGSSHGRPDKDGKQLGIRKQLGGIDYGGNVIFVAGVTLILFALVYGGSRWPWTSYSTLLCLIGGFVLLIVFAFYEDSKYCVKPTIPIRLLRNRTTATAFVLTFIQSLLTLEIFYFLPVYFQAVLLSSPTTSGVNTLPTVLLLLPSAAVGGALLSKFGRFKYFHFGGFGLMTIAFTGYSTLTRSSPTAYWAALQIVAAAGAGLVTTTLLPAAQASLSDTDIASATATWAFLRSFGIVWGVAVPAAIFDAQAQNFAGKGLIDNAALTAMFATGGGAYEHSTAAFVSSVAAGTLRNSVITLYEQSLSATWIFGTALAGLGFLLVFVEKEVILRDKMESIDEKTKELEL